MACRVNLLLYVHIFVVLMKFGTFLVSGEPQVPCYFIFGDSLVDSGNNNGLETVTKANYAPYGIDFPLGVTGRFSNGRTMADIIGELLDFDEFIPPYTTATDQQIIKGVNYGSGGAGIREETGSNLGDRISLHKQLLNHNTTVSRLSRLQQNITFTNEYLKKCIYVVNMGSNDYINNYLMPNFYSTSNMYTPKQYAKVLTRHYSQHLKTLYNLGGRKVVVFGLGPIGCTPAEITLFGTDGKPCVESINDAVKHFDDRLKLLIDELNHDNLDARFTFVNLTSISTLQQGMGLPSVPCCQVNAYGLCTHNVTICLGRASSIYYDALHPTEMANTVIATISYSALSMMDASPYDISHLAQL